MLARVKDSLVIMSDNGYVPGKKGNKKVLHDLVRGYAEHYGVTMPRTEKTGAIQTSADSLALLPVEKIPFLKAYQDQDHYNKICKNWLDLENVGPDGRMHTRFKTIVLTGRTSSSNPNLCRQSTYNYLIN